MNVERIEELIVDARNGNSAAHGELLRLINDRAERLSHNLLTTYPVVRRWFDTGDVRQLALVRTQAALRAIELNDAEHLNRLVALKVRQTVLDLRRKVLAVHGLAQHEGGVSIDDSSDDRLHPAQDTHDPARLAEWMEIHETIANLPDEDRRMFDLLWYNELGQEEAARVLGLSVRQVKRRWRDAKIRFARDLGRPFER